MKSKMVEKKFTKIYFRIFPMEKMIWDYLKILSDHKTIYIRCLQELAKSKENVVPTFWTFRTDNVFFNHGQKEIYDEIIPEVLDNVSEGYDAIIMAYGQTGTGKSLTVNGIYNPFEDRGILPRVASDLFEKLETDTSKRNVTEWIQVSYVEFSKTGINDLLRPYPNHIYSLKDLKKITIKNVEDAFKIFFKGEGRKIFSENSRYESHSYSSIFTFHITKKNDEMQENCLSKCKLHIVDLAGADTVGNFSCLFKNPFEIGAANLAKTQLEQFFLVLCSDISEHIRIKQRLHPIILHLGDSLNKTSIIRLVGHIRTTREDLLITISMLKFGQLVGGLKSTRFEVKIDPDVSREKLESLQKELARLKLENQYNTILMHQDLSKSLNEERFAHIERTVNEYLQNKITQLTLLNVCDINIALEIMKMMCKKNEENTSKKEELLTKVRKGSSSSGTKVHPRSSRASTKTSSSDGLPKKTSDENSKQSTSAALDSKQTPKGQSLQDVTTKSKSRTSNSSMVKRPSIKRKSNSSASLRERSKSKSKENVLLPQIPPEYNEAWNLYLSEHNDDYLNYMRSYERSEVAAKNVYRTYLSELDNLREIASRVGKHKKNLLMAKMTREFQQAYQSTPTSSISEFEKCCKKELEKAEQEQIEKQELVLKYQTELKTYINLCKNVKQDLQNNFNDFCKAKFQGMVISEAVEKGMDIVEDLTKQPEGTETQTLEEDKEAKAFENLKPLIDMEKRKRKLYQMRHREWVTY